MRGRLMATGLAALLAGAGCERAPAPASAAGGGAAPAGAGATEQESARLRATVARLHAQNAGLRKALGESRRVRSQIAEGDFDLWEYAERMDELRAENARLRAELDEKTRVIAKLAEVGLPIKDLLGDEDGSAAPAIHGKVLAVRSEVNLLMLSVGSNQKVTKGLRFTVYRDDRYVGKVEVEQVFADMSSARILGAWTKDRAKEGDDASTAP